MISQLNKLSSIQALRAVAILLVLAAHMRGFEVSLHIKSVFDTLIPAEATGVDLFFVISGFIMMFVHWDDFGAGKSLKFLQKRLVRIFPMYWILTTFIAVLFARFPGISAHWLAGNTGMVQSYLLLPQNHMPLLFVGWSLVNEMYFYYVFALLLIVSRKRAGILFGAWAAALVVMQYFLFSAPPAIGMMESNMTISFLFGVGIAALAKTQVMRFAVPSLLVGFVSYVFWAAVGIQHEEHWIEDSHFRYLMAGLPMAMILYSFVAMEIQGKLRISKPLEYIGDASYSIYLSHVLSYAAFMKTMLVVTHHVAVPTPVILLAGYVCAIGLGLLMYRFVERPLTKYLGDLIRARKSPPAAVPI